VVFSASGKAAVSYRVLAAVALASGDPLGNVEAWPGAISEFLTQCRRFGWVPAVLGCSESGAKVWTRHGRLDALELGDEAVIDVAGFSLQGRAMRSVRQAVSRVRRAGYQTQVRRIVDIPVGELAALRALVERWRGTPAERGFSMALSRFGEPELDPDALVVTATLEGQVRALLQFVPWGQDALSLDLMIRDASVPDNGLNELLIVDLLAACRDLEVSRVSLNFAVFRSALERGERIGAGPVARLWARLLRIASRWWQIETLYRFNARFAPAWVPRFLVFDAVRDLPRIAVAAFEAEDDGNEDLRQRYLAQAAAAYEAFLAAHPAQDAEWWDAKLRTAEIARQQSRFEDAIRIADSLVGLKPPGDGRYGDMAKQIAAKAKLRDAEPANFVPKS